MTDFDKHWNKLSFIYDGDDGNGDVESEYREKLYNVLDEILHRLKKLEDKSHMHKFQLLSDDGRKRFNSRYSGNGYQPLPHDDGVPNSPPANP